MIPQQIIDRLTDKISVSVERVLENMRDGSIETEPNITDRLLANLERDFEPERSYNQKDRIALRTRTLRDRGAKAPENIYGADLATLLDIDLLDYRLQKGFLAQSKWVPDPKLFIKARVEIIHKGGGLFSRGRVIQPDVNSEKYGQIAFDITKADYDRMYRQCEEMLKVTSDSFVFIYSSDDLYVIPASAVVSAPHYNKRQKYYCKNFKLFMTDYLKSFIGDVTLRGIADRDFEQIKQRTNARNIVEFQIIEDRDPPLFGT